MHRSGLMIAAALTLASPSIASATAYRFSATETSALSASPETFTFSLDTATAGGASSSGDASFGNVTITANGRPSAGQTVAASFTTDLASALFFFVDTGTTPFYSGTGTGLTFNTGTFAIADGLTDGEGTLTVAASASAAPVPEPATWAVLLGGVAVAGAAGLARRARWSMGSGAAAA